MSWKQSACFATFWLVACACCTSDPAKAAPSQEAPIGEAPVEAATLPAGNSSDFRDRLLSWKPQTRSGPAAEMPLRLPTVNRLSSGFGTRSDPFNGRLRFHAGIDLPERFGAPVRSSGPGVVRLARWVRGYGNMVEIDHGHGIHSRYGHLARILVAENQPIIDDDIVGLVGSTGHSTGNHLHFEIRLNESPIDPIEFIERPSQAHTDIVVPLKKRHQDWQSSPDPSRLPTPSLD